MAPKPYDQMTGVERTRHHLAAIAATASRSERFGCGCVRHTAADGRTTLVRHSGAAATHRPSGATADVTASKRAKRSAARQNPGIARPRVETRSGGDVVRGELQLLESSIDRLARKGDQRTLAEDQRLRSFRAHRDALSAARAADDARAVAEAREKVESRRRAALTGVEVDPMRATAVELRDGALRVLEARSATMAPEHADRLEALVRSTDPTTHGAHIARRLLLTENDAYRSAFARSMNLGLAKPLRTAYTPEEARAINEFRAMAEGGTAGLGVPVTIDPSLTLSAQASDAPLVRLGSVKVIPGAVYKGVSTPGAGWAIKSEGAAIGSDSTPSLTQAVDVEVSAAAAWIPYSIEVGQDFPNFAEEMAGVLSAGYVDLLASQSMVGSAPDGLFVRLQGVTTNPAHVTVTTAGTIGVTDVRATWASLPQRFRSRAVWFMSPTVEEQVKAFDGSAAQVDYSTRITDAGVRITSLMGRPVVVSDYAPSFTGTTGAENFLAVGDPTTWVTVVGGGGMTVEAVDTVFDHVTGRPSGERGFIGWSRFGFGLSAANGWRLLANT